MTSRCEHAGWGSYRGETGPCPPPADLVPIEDGVECPVCDFHVRTFVGAEAMSRAFAMDRETATLSRETR